MRSIPFAGLHNHTEYSNMRMHDCISKLDDLIYTSYNMGYSGIVITDHDCLSGSLRALEIEEKIHETDKNFRVGLGNEIYLIEDQPLDDVSKYFHFLLIARTKQGFEYLKQLSSRAWGRSKFVRGIRRVPTFYSDIEEIVKTKGDLIASSACLGSEFSTLVTQYLQDKSIETKQKIAQFISWCINIFGREYFYIEIQSSTNPEQIEYNIKALQIAKAFGLKVVLTEDTHFLRKEDSSIHKAFVEAARSTKNEDDNDKDYYEGCHLKDENELRQRLSYVDDDTFNLVCQNTVNIIQSLEQYSLKQNTIIPLRKLPEFNVMHLFKDWYEECPTIKQYAYSQYEQDRFLISEVEKGFIKLKQKLNETNVHRIESELDVLSHISEELNQRLSSYYNLMQVILDIVWNEGDSIVGVARGSATAFYLCYLMGITQINPILYDLPYFRHLNYARAGAMPD